MQLTDEEKQIMISVLRTLIYNDIDDLKPKLISAKEELSYDKYNLMIYGDQDLFPTDADVKNKDKYKKISLLDGRWCLNTILFYAVNNSKKITKEQHTEMLLI